MNTVMKINHRKIMVNTIIILSVQNIFLKNFDEFIEAHILRYIEDCTRIQ
jgi:hypothetical protein